MLNCFKENSYGNRHHYFFHLTGLLLPTFCLAQESVFDLTLEQLQQVNVSVSSKVNLPLQLSPASVTTYNKQQLFEQGIHQLADLADVSLGYSSYSIYGERVFETRGQKAGSFENNKHLLLLDGIRINHARANKAPIENELPLWMMGKLELLRGPASALYGQSAFLGVVSLQSDFTNENELDAQVNYQGTADGIRANFRGNFTSAIGHSYVAYSHFEKGSSDALVGPEFSPLQKYYDDQKAEFSYLRQKYDTKSLGQFTLGYIELSRQSGLGEHWSGDFSVEENQIDWVTKVSYLSWEKSITSQINALVKLVNNSSSEQGVFSNENREQVSSGVPVTYSQYQVNVTAKLIEGEINWQLEEQKSLILGGSYEQRQEQGDFFATGFTEVDISQKNMIAENISFFPREDSAKKINQAIYFQYYDLLSNWYDIHLTAGIRYDKGEYLSDSFSQWSPRIALVKMLSTRLTLKGSYSSALRAPTLKEYLLNAEAKDFISEQAQNPDRVLERLPEKLLAETIDSTELTLSYQKGEVLVKVNGYYNHTENLLNGQPVSFVNQQGKIISQNSFINSQQDYSVYGAEFEVQWRFLKNWQINAFLSQSKPKSNSQEASVDIAKFKSMLSLTGVLRWFTVNFVQTYHGDISANLEDISRFDVTISKQSRWYNKNISAYIKILNVFDQKNYHSFDNEVGNPLPQREVSMGFSYQF